MKHKPGAELMRLGLFIIIFSSVLLASGCGVWSTRSDRPQRLRGGGETRSSAGTEVPAVPEKPVKADRTHSTHQMPAGETPHVSVVEVTPHEPPAARHPTPRKTISAVDESPVFPPDTMRTEFKEGGNNSKLIALTFDAGASPKPTSSILSTLERYSIRSTFFLTGKWMEANPDLTRQIVEHGHSIANHTYSHPDLRKLTDDQIREQLTRTEQIAQDVAGVSTKPFFRPPYGGRDPRIKDIAAEEGFRSVFWSVDSWDAFKKGIMAQEVQDRVLSRAKGGSVVLMHCGSAATAEALPSIIEELQARGYRIVTIAELVSSQ